MKVSASNLGWRTVIPVGVLLVLLLVWAFFHRQIDRSIAAYLLLNSDSPREELFDETVKESNHPVNFLNRCWATGKVAHRQLVAAFLKDKALGHPPWFSRAEPLVLAGATDEDASVRELALAALESGRSPRLFELAVAQLNDLDPMVRLLGLDYLRKADRNQALPVVVQLLDDPDLRVVARAEVALTRWSGEDFGVRARLAIPPDGTGQSGEVEPANAEAIRRGVERRKEWWKLHEKDYPTTLPTANLNTRVSNRLPTQDFALKDLTGSTVHLNQFQGKVVLLNFWATWCTACLAEIPDLIALQKKLGDQVVILGVALDGVPDEHGHVPGEEESGTTDHREHSIANARAKVVRAVQARGINYTVLWDPKSSLGAQFNGGELPTTVLIDPQGRVRRRFIGERNLAVFEAMVAEAAGQFEEYGSHSVAQHD